MLTVPQQSLPTVRGLLFIFILSILFILFQFKDSKWLQKLSSSDVDAVPNVLV